MTDIVKCISCKFYTPKMTINNTPLAIGYCDQNKNRIIRKIVKQCNPKCSKYMSK